MKRVDCNIYTEENATHELFGEQESVFVNCGTFRQGTETLDSDQALKLYGDSPLMNSNSKQRLISHAIFFLIRKSFNNYAFHFIFSRTFKTFKSLEVTFYKLPYQWYISFQYNLLCNCSSNR